MSNISLRHYPTSPLSKKIRLVLGYKKLAWKSVVIAVIMPKPDVVALTGGYRGTPFIQIGADNYCDSALIADVLERIQPTPTIYPDASAAPGASSRNGRIRRCSGPRCRTRCGRHWLHICRHAAGGRQGLCRGSRGVSLQRAARATILDIHPRILVWSERMQAIGQGASEKMTSEAAIAVAQAGAPAPFTEPWAHVHEAAPGDLVTVTPTDTGFDPVEGALVISRTNEVEIRRSDPRAGEVVVHFPRVGFQLKKRDPQGVVN